MGKGGGSFSVGGEMKPTLMKLSLSNFFTSVEMLTFSSYNAGVELVSYGWACMVH